ncbi:peptidylprolyl isomerase [Paracoccus sp. MC1854]|uniref:peptidylprolyl isomerase n=1 Tax=Paracoccus sp. MC1854 TaxID=2760306 RepID=UPI002104CBD3|nr:peptidylprolyl isomerase [Paracoccus sp. MC1854]
MLKSLPALMAAALMAAPALAQAPAETPPATAEATGAPRADTVVATVNGEAITLGQMIAMRESLHSSAVEGLPDAALWDLMLDQMIRQAAVAQVAAQSPSPRDKAVLENERRGYQYAATLEKVAAPEPSEEELRAAYDAAFGTQTEPRTEYSAAHILVATEEEARAIADELANGADFGTLAEERSTDNSSGNKGDLGWFTADMMVKPFADAVVALEKGAISAPVQSQFGWHVIRLNDSRTQTPPEFEAVRDQLANEVRRQKVEAEVQARVDAATIEKTPGLDPTLLSRSELLDN